MTERAEKFRKVLLRCQSAYNANPGFFPFEAIIRQLSYLIDFEEGVTQDIEPLKKIRIGWIAVRELDGYGDLELIKALCEVEHESDLMRNERGGK